MHTVTSYHHCEKKSGGDHRNPSDWPVERLYIYTNAPGYTAFVQDTRLAWLSMTGVSFSPQKTYIEDKCVKFAPKGFTVTVTQNSLTCEE